MSSQGVPSAATIGGRQEGSPRCPWWSSSDSDPVTWASILNHPIFQPGITKRNSGISVNVSGDASVVCRYGRPVIATPCKELVIGPPIFEEQGNGSGTSRNVLAPLLDGRPSILCATCRTPEMNESSTGKIRVRQRFRHPVRRDYTRSCHVSRCRDLWLNGTTENKIIL